MKLLALYFVAAAAIVALAGAKSVAVPPEFEAQFKQVIAKCQKEHNVPEADVERLRNAQYDNTSRDAKCFLNCYAEASQWLVNGELNTALMRDVMGPILGKEKIEKAIKDCNGIKDNDKCERVMKLYQCYKKHGAAYL